jgi:hypothetical protein
VKAVVGDMDDAVHCSLDLRRNGVITDVDETDRETVATDVCQRDQ